MGVAAESEAGFQRAVVELAWRLGFRAYHTLDSRGSAEGFPDLVLKRRVRPRGPWKVRLVAELKARGKRPTPAQREWLEAFELAGVPAYWWTPDHWSELREVLAALAA